MTDDPFEYRPTLAKDEDVVSYTGFEFTADGKAYNIHLPESDTTANEGESPDEYDARVMGVVEETIYRQDIADAILGMPDLRSISDPDNPLFTAVTERAANEAAMHIAKVYLHVVKGEIEERGTEVVDSSRPHLVLSPDNRTISVDFDVEGAIEHAATLIRNSFAKMPEDTARPMRDLVAGAYYKALVDGIAESMDQAVFEGMGEAEFMQELGNHSQDMESVMPVLEGVAAWYSQHFARVWIDGLNLREMTLEQFEKILGLRASKGDSPVPEHRVLRDGYMNVMNDAVFHGLREAISDPSRFTEHPTSKLPTADLKRGGVVGQVTLKPAGMDRLLSPEAAAELVQRMWDQRSELSDLDADALDMLSAIWIDQADDLRDRATVRIDELLELRGLKKKRGGRGVGGYGKDQREKMLSSLSHILNLWLTMAEMDAFEDTGRGRRKTRKAIQSRAFVITDRMGQLRMDDAMDMDVEAIRYHPGDVFATFLMGPGRQTALLSAKAIQYHPKNQKWEKRLARYLSWLWRVQATSGEHMVPYRISKLLEGAGETINMGRPSRTRERLELALDTLLADGVIAAWQYHGWDESTGRGWWKRWLETTVLIEPPGKIRDQYRTIQVEALKPQAKESAPLQEHMRAVRNDRGLSQMQAAEDAGVTQQTWSRVERTGKTSKKVRRAIEAWAKEDPATPQNE